jgi:hypothetical protein
VCLYGQPQRAGETVTFGEALAWALGAVLCTGLIFAAGWVALTLDARHHARRERRRRRDL